MSARLLLLTAAAFAPLLAACDDEKGSRNSTPTTADASPQITRISGTPAADAGVQHATFAAGETIDFDGPGIVFVDVATGASDAWYVPSDDPLAFRVSSISDDGRLFLYACTASPATGLLPCGGKAGDLFVWRLLDTVSGQSTMLREFTGPSVTLSPDGTTLIGMRNGSKGDVFIAAPVSDPDDVGELEFDRAPATQQFSASWSPGGESVAIALGVPGIPGRSLHVLRLNNDANSAVRLPFDRGRVAWSPDASAVAIARYDDVRASGEPGMVVFDVRDGSERWSTANGLPVANPRWSPDGSMLAAELSPATQAPTRLDAYDAESGATVFRISNVIACGGPVWTSDGSRLILGAADGHVIANVGDRTLEANTRNLTPAPFGGTLAIEHANLGFAAFDLATGERRQIARYAQRVVPAWFYDHEPLFAGERIVFLTPHLSGHGGCSEKSGVPLGEPAFERPPFGD